MSEDKNNPKPTLAGTVKTKLTRNMAPDYVSVQRDNKGNVTGITTPAPGTTPSPKEPVRSQTVALPKYDEGTDYVPSDQVAQLHEGEAVVPAGQNPNPPQPAAAPNGQGAPATPNYNEAVGDQGQRVEPARGEVPSQPEAPVQKQHGVLASVARALLGHLEGAARGVQTSAQQHQQIRAAQATEAQAQARAAELAVSGHYVKVAQMQRELELMPSDKQEMYQNQGAQNTVNMIEKGVMAPVSENVPDQQTAINYLNAARKNDPMHTFDVYPVRASDGSIGYQVGQIIDAPLKADWSYTTPTGQTQTIPKGTPGKIAYARYQMDMTQSAKLTSAFAKSDHDAANKVKTEQELEPVKTRENQARMGSIPRTFKLTDEKGGEHEFVYQNGQVKEITPGANSGGTSDIPQPVASGLTDRALPQPAGTPVTGNPAHPDTVAGYKVQYPSGPAPTESAQSPKFVKPSLAAHMMWGSAPNGRQVAGDMGQMRASGVEHPVPMGQAEQDKVLAARQMVAPDGLFQALKQDIDRLEKKGQLGVFITRLNTFKTQKIGTGPEFAAFLADNALTSTRTMQVHVGLRGSNEMLRHFEHLSNYKISDAATLRAALRAEYNYTHERAMLPDEGK